MIDWLPFILLTVALGAIPLCFLFGGAESPPEPPVSLDAEWQRTREVDRREVDRWLRQGWRLIAVTNLSGDFLSAGRTVYVIGLPGPALLRREAEEREADA